jgi:hypothetical protein
MGNEKYILSFNSDNFVAAVNEEGYERDVNHKYLIYGDSAPKGFVSLATKYLTEYYLGQIRQDIKKWKKDHTLYNLNWQPPEAKVGFTSKKINYLKIAEELRSESKFDIKKFILPPIECLWLDRSIDISLNCHMVESGSKEALSIIDGTPQQQYGGNYPINPKLDREGHIFTTFQPQLIKRIVKQRKSIIENSENALNPDWVLDLRSVINDSISLIDITLNQLYNKAEYSPKPGWTFNKKIMGEKNSRRIKDKLKWVRQISGNPLEIENEVPKLDRLRKLRNHLNHFDPPTLVITLEEATLWLNDILYIGMILVKIRKALNAPLSNPLIDLIVQREAVFNPEAAFQKRLPIVFGQTGYSSAIWNDDEE